MRVENISTNQPNFSARNYKSVFKRFVNLFSKSTSEQAFTTTATATAATAIAAIEMSKKEYEASKLTNKTITDVEQDSLNWECLFLI